MAFFFPPTATFMSLSYNFGLGARDNGNVLQIVNNLDSTRSANFQYDNLNRLLQVNTATTTGANCWGETYTIDNWGNCTNQSVTAGSCISFSAAALNSNRLSGYQYDAAGNMTNDGRHSYTYDAENRIVSVDGGATTYFYDAQGRRARKTTGGSWLDFLYDLGGRPTAEYNQNGWATGYVYFAGRLAAQYSNSTTYFVHSDHLGSTRVMTNVSGGVYDSMNYLPFGEQIAGGTGTTHKFTGKERDAESGLDNFGARYDSSSLGRFMTPDWAAKPATVPYAKFGDPQSLNLYSYVENSPVNEADADGHRGTQINGENMWLSPRDVMAHAVDVSDSFGDPMESFTGAVDVDGQFQGMVAGMLQNAPYEATYDPNQPLYTPQGVIPGEQLKFKTVSGGQGTTWEIQWSLTHNTKVGGWIVQHIVADFAGAGHYDYWEAWPVSANSHTPSIHGTDANGTSYSDMFAGNSGSHIHSSARFYDGLTLPSSFKVQPGNFPAGILRATTTDPKISTQNATPANVRWWGD